MTIDIEVVGYKGLRQNWKQNSSYMKVVKLHLIDT